ncbi:MAG: hypothetical protein IJW09_03950 [Clostridia bacterium]|nr:hypothetical protein [Clostridia bacterium]
MENNYRVVKLKKKIWLFIFGIFAAAVTLTIMTQNWGGLLIPGLFLLVSVVVLKSDRILYNEKEVLLTILPGRKERLAWHQIKGVTIELKSKWGRGHYLVWKMTISYYDYLNRLQTVEKNYSDLDGAQEFYECFKKVKGYDW